MMVFTFLSRAVYYGFFIHIPSSREVSFDNFGVRLRSFSLSYNNVGFLYGSSRFKQSRIPYFGSKLIYYRSLLLITGTSI